MHKRAVLVEDHPLVRTGLRVSLKRLGIQVCGEADDGIVALELILREAPDLAVIDLGLPGKDGITLIRELRASGCTTRVVILTMAEAETEVIAALSAGADAYCVKSSGRDSFEGAVQTVVAGGAFFDPRIADVVLRRLRGIEAQSSPLSPREREILGLIAEGAANAEIARRLTIGLATVKTHVAEIFRKLAASDRAHATAIALRGGLLR